MFKLADCLIELLQGRVGHTFGGKAVPMVDSLWKVWEFAIISCNSYQSVGCWDDYVKMVFKWNKEVRNRYGN